MVRYTVGSTVELQLKRGDSEDIYVQWLIDATPMDLTGWTAEFIDADSNDIDATVTIPSPTSGQVRVAMTNTQTQNATEQYFRLRVYQGGSAQTLLEGRINLV